MNSSTPSGYDFTTPWFEYRRPVWDSLVPQINPRRILEIGSYEGASACYLIDTLSKDAAIELHCVDSWEGGVEHQDDGSDMAQVELRFRMNVEKAKANAAFPVDLVLHKGNSDICLASLFAQGRAEFFDFIYVDGSHQAPDVLIDAVLSFKLLRVGGVLVFDDYIWAEELPQGRDPLRCPKPAIDAFVNCYFRKLQIIPAPLYQLYLQKTSN